MNRLFSSFVAILFTLLPMSALSSKATSIDSWTTYFSYYDATDVIEGDGMVYAIMSGNVLSYDLKTNEVHQIDKLYSSLSDMNVKFLGYSNSQHTLVIIYSNGNIDLLNTRTDEVTNIPQFKDNPDNDFALNDLFVEGDNALLSTNEGLLWISVKQGVIKGRYPIGGCTSAAIYQGKVFAALKICSVLTIGMNENLLDASLWTKFSGNYITRMGLLGEDLFMMAPYVAGTTGAYDTFGLWSLSKAGVLTRLNKLQLTNMMTDGKVLIAHNANEICEVKASEPQTVNTISVTHGCECIYPASDGGCWTAKKGSGITHYALSTSGFVADASSFGCFGPRYDLPYFLRFYDETLYLAGGRTDPTDGSHNTYTAMWMDEYGDWHEFETPTTANGYLMKHLTVSQDATSISKDPLDSNHYFVTTGRNGIFEYNGDRIIKQYTQGNSKMESCSSSKSYDHVRCDAGIMDDQGNFYVANNSVDTAIWCRKASGEWIPFYYTPISKARWFEKSLIDTKGRLWVAQRSADSNVDAGFLCMDFNGTLDMTRDDVYTYRTSFINEDGTAFTFHSAYCLAQDHDGRIWMGTDEGLVVVDNPDDWANSDFLITQVKVPRNDGTNYADYLLNGAAVTAIAIDGANRKWIGTQGDGVYLISADGITTIYHFLSSNSPLISDNIWNIACHPKNGEVFIGTDIGLMSYHSDASETEESLSRDNLRVYPNPVRPDYSGPVVLDGLVYDSDVKVVSTSGHTVAAGTSIGGTFTWDGRGPSGERVGSGIYYFMVSSPDGKQSVVAKVAVVR